MQITKLLRSCTLAASVAGALLQSSTLFAADRISINDDWRFIKGDPNGATATLTYPKTPRGEAPATTGIAAFILPTGNSLIADPAKRFAKPEGNIGGDISYVQPNFDDASWQQLDLPHDFAAAGPFIVNGQPGSDGATGRLPFFGQVWYRKHLTIPAADAGKQLYLDMDGSMSYTTVWCNGQIVGGWPYGYTSWRVDLTPYLKAGADNVLAIRLDNPANSSRWYPGGGIYRNVWLVKSSPVHVGQWGTYVATPTVSAAAATVEIKATVDNDTKAAATVSVTHDLFALDADGKKVGPPVASITTDGIQVPAGGSSVADGKITFNNPKLWSPKTPNTYTVVTTIKNAGAVADTCETPTGIRTIKYDPNAGLFINGEHFKMNGVCDHHDLGALGTAVNFRALQRQLEILHDMGCNAIRTSHNPPAPELLELADRMGFMVLDEAFDTWGTNKRPNDYGGGNLFNAWHEQDMRALIRRDRNHPSVVMWSIGNEIAEQSQGRNSAAGKELSAIVHSEDPTRPVAAACDNAGAMTNGFSELLDAMGFNYKPDNYIPFHQKYPAQFFFASESASTVSSRGEYYFPVIGPGFGTPNGGNRGPAGAPTFVSLDNAAHQVSSYDLYCTATVTTSPDHEFFGQDHSPAVAGEFVWTGFDYIGEPAPWGRNNDPSRSAYFGINDLAGFPKDRFFLYQAHWRPDFPMAHILPHWNWPDRIGQVTPVHVYTSGDEAELFLNGKSLGRKKKVFEANTTPAAVNGIPLAGQPAYRIRWDDVKYEPGELKVVAYKDGKQWVTDVVKTTGPAAKLLLAPDRATIAADGHDLSFVKLTVADNDGLMVPKSCPKITFEVTGPGEIVATDNGDATDLVAFPSHERKAYNGLALVIVKAKRGSTGAVTVTAKSDGLAVGTTVIQTK